MCQCVQAILWLGFCVVLGTTGCSGILDPDASQTSLADESSAAATTASAPTTNPAPPAELDEKYLSDPDFHQKTKETLDGWNKLTLVYCFASKEIKWDHESVDFDVAKHVAYRLNSRTIRVVDPDPAYAWLDKHDRWRKTSEIGAAFKADYVVHIDIKDYSLNEPNTNTLYRGQADCIVNVVKMDENRTDGTVIYTVPIKSSFPKNGPVDQSAMPITEFKKRYLSALSHEIGKLFYSTEIVDDDPPAKEVRATRDEVERDGLDQWLFSPKYRAINRNLGVD